MAQKNPKPRPPKSDDTNKMRAALLSMGYREAKPQTWLKPIGFQLFTYEEKFQRWTNWFKGANGKMLIWDSHTTADYDDPLRNVKEWEAFTRTDMYCGCNSAFQLSAFDL